jgi:hypothetical protein
MRLTGLTFVFAVVLAASLVPLGAQTLGGCAVFPADNIWNTPIDSLPLAANSAAYINSIGAVTGLHPDFGSGLWDGAPIGIPYVLVNGSQPKKFVAFDYADESDAGPYPIPDNPPIEGGPTSTGDRHVLIVDSTSCVLYELYAAYPQADGTWHAGSGAIFDLKGNQLRPRNWTSADAAGLPILPGLVRYDEVRAGEIKHAIRFTIAISQRAYVWPARHYASSNTSSAVPPMGQRFRLRAGFDISGFAPAVQVILTAMKKYGIIVADNGANWYIAGAPDERWNNDELGTLRRVKGADFEAVDISGLVVNVDSAQANVPNGALLSAVTLQPSTVIGGQTTTRNTVALVGPAPNGGAVVTLTSSNPGIAMVPPTATIAAGSATATFAIATASVPIATQVTISAAYNGGTRSANLTVTPGALTGFSISPSSVTGGASATGMLALGGPAPAGGALVALSSNSGAVTVSPSVTVPAASASATFPVSTIAVTARTTATVSAVYAGTTLTASLTVNAPPATLTLSRNPVAGGVRLTGRVTLSTAAAARVTVSLASSDSSIASTPSSVAIAAGATSATFTIDTHAVSAPAQVVISASYSGATASANLTVNAAALQSVSVPFSARSGRTVTGRVYLTGTAAAPGVVSLASSNPAAASVPATVTIPASASSAAFSLAALTVTAPSSLKISATYKTVTASDAITVRP